MKITIAMDSFKGSLTTLQAGNAVAEGIKTVYEDAKLNICPLADGGEGTVEAITAALGGEIVEAKVTDPLGRKITGKYGYIPNRSTAVVEMSAAAGITLIDRNERNPLKTTTYGVGELILDAVSKGCRRFIVGIGGSATNDGGVGMLQALGVRFLDREGNEIQRGAQGLKDIYEIDGEGLSKEVRESVFKVACDVNNPLCGENGCSVVYGPQKGATTEMIKDMDEWLGVYAKLTKKVFPMADDKAPGAGAAGGMGFAFMSYLNASLVSGIDLVIEETGIEKKISDSDILVTGEGCLDSQTCMGKAPVGVAKLAKKYGVKVIAFSGSVTDSAGLCNENGIDAFFSVTKRPCTLQEAMETEIAYNSLRDTSEQVFRLIKSIKDGNK